MTLKTMLVATFVCVAGALSTGCANPCGDLEDQCAECGNPLEKGSCDLVVAVDDSDSCDAALDLYCK
jgi:hypothetical protein